MFIQPTSVIRETKVHTTDYEHIFEVCLGVSSRNIVNKNYLLGKNVLMHIVHFISSTTYICISMCISLNTTMLSKHENTV